MTSDRASDGPSRGADAPTRTTGTRDGIGAIVAVLALGLVFRLIIAQLNPGSGFRVDIGTFQAWAANLAAEGLRGFYERPFFHDYTPGYLYVLAAVGTVGRAIGSLGDLIKIPPILADVVLGWLVWSMARELGAGRRAALIGGALVVANPVTWLDSVLWGQVDSFGVVFLLLGIRELWRDRPERAAIFTVVAALIKPQLAILAPIVAVVTIRRALRPLDRGAVHDDAAAAIAGRPAWQPAWLGRILAAERRTDHPLRIVTTGLTGFVTAVVLCFPFGLSVLEPGRAGELFRSGLIEQVFKTAGGYPYASVNAYNLWSLASVNGTGVAANSGWACDTIILNARPPDPSCPQAVMFGSIPAVYVGAALLVVAFVLVSLAVARRPTPLSILTGVAILAIAFFVLPTRVHERYLYPVVAVGAVLAAVSIRWRIAYLVLSATTFLNMYVVLTTLYGDNPGVRDWLGIGSDIRTSGGVTTIAVIATVAALWAFTQLRHGAQRALAREIEASADPDDWWDETAEDGDGWVAAEGEPSPGGRATGPAASADAGAGAAHWAPEALGGAAVAGTPAVPGDARAWRSLAVEASDPERRAVPRFAASSADAAAATAATPPASLAWGPPPSIAELGPIGWFRAKLGERPLRADRSRELHHEGRGRFDRFDLWLLAVLVISILGIRMWRLSEPYQMHFDEVYHARTATEFLQDWRYGISHDIYEWTHPHLAKYAMAGGLVAWGNDRVTASSEIGAPVVDAAIEPRFDEPSLPRARGGDRVDVATGSEVRSYDLANRFLVATIPVAGASAVAADASGERVFVGSSDGSIATIDGAELDALRASPGGPAPEAVPFTTLDGPVRRLLVTADGRAVLAILADDQVVTLDADTADIRGRVQLDATGDLATAGTAPALTASADAVEDPAAAARTIAQIVGGDAATYETRLRGALDRSVVAPITTADQRTKLQAAIDDGRLGGLSIDTVDQVAVADANGVEMIDPGTGALTRTVDVGAPAHGLALTTVDDPKLYVATDPDPQTTQKGRISIVAVGGNAAKDGPVVLESMAMPGPVTRVAYDEATEMVHVLGRTPDGSASTVYVIEPHARAVYADARLPFEPSAWAIDALRMYPSSDREQILAFSDTGAVASVDVGQHEFAWRLPGVIAGTVMAGLLYVLARILFRRRSVALLVGVLTLTDGMLFVQSRIGMNDAYVGVFIVAAYTLFAALWLGVWRNRAAFWLAMPVVGALLGLGLASKWVALYAVGGIGILILARSALGRLIAVAAMVVLTAVLGYLAVNVPAGSGFGNLPFVAIMVGLTVVAVVANVAHPIQWSLDEIRFAVGAPIAVGGAAMLALIAIGRAAPAAAAAKAVGAAAQPAALGGLPVSLPMALAIAVFLLGPAVWLAFAIAGRIGFGPLAAPPAPDTSAALVPPPAPPPAESWLRPGALFGLPILWMVLSLVAIPVAIYVASYIPWAFVENHRLFGNWPNGHTGQSLIDLTGAMYAYHNGLPTPHPASSPWWAWPFDLKPVWFHQESYGSNTIGAIYDAGNVVSWWLGVPAMLFVAWQAWARRSLPLALIAIAYAFQWISWARIERAAFQYHYYTSLPFLFLALAYFLAELWHGASRRTWLLARLSAAAGILGPALLWIFDRPLCAFVGVTKANPGSQACPPVIPQFLLTTQTAAMATVVGVSVLVVIRLLGRLGEDDEPAGPGTGQSWTGDPGAGELTSLRETLRLGDRLGLSERPEPAAARTTRSGRASAWPGDSPLVPLLVTAVAAIALTIGVRSFVPDQPLVTLDRIPVEPVAIILGLPALALAAFVATARDARRFVLGAVAAFVAWFVVAYPNISALPLPTAIANVYQGVLPTYLYAFQFPVNNLAASVPVQLLGPIPLLLGGAMIFLVLVIGYAAWVWRVALAERLAAKRDRLEVGGGRAGAGGAGD